MLCDNIISNVLEQFGFAVQKLRPGMFVQLSHTVLSQPNMFYASYTIILWVKISADNILKYFSRKTGSAFHANCLHWRQVA